MIEREKEKYGWEFHNRDNTNLLFSISILQYIMQLYKHFTAIGKVRDLHIVSICHYHTHIIIYIRGQAHNISN